MGGFTMSLKLFIDDLELDTDLRSYDINGTFMTSTLLENKIDARLENIFDGDNVDPEVIEYIQSEGTTVVLCCCHESKEVPLLVSTPLRQL